jgi:predicted  nucleic acid-binding Zn-ribbon protein
MTDTDTHTTTCTMLSMHSDSDEVKKLARAMLHVYKRIGDIVEDLKTPFHEVPKLKQQLSELKSHAEKLEKRIKDLEKLQGR